MIKFFCNAQSETNIPPPKACIYNVLKLMLEELWNTSDL